MWCDCRKKWGSYKLNSSATTPWPSMNTARGLSKTCRRKLTKIQFRTTCWWRFWGKRSWTSWTSDTGCTSNWCSPNYSKVSSNSWRTSTKVDHTAGTQATTMRMNSITSKIGLRFTRAGRSCWILLSSSERRKDKICIWCLSCWRILSLGIQPKARSSSNDFCFFNSPKTTPTLNCLVNCSQSTL